MKKYRSQCNINYARIKTLHPGEFYQMRLKSSPLLSDIAYNITIHDSSEKEYIDKKQCYAIAVSYEISQELLYYKQLSINNMCKELKVSRVIILESSILNPLSPTQLAKDLVEEIQLMKPEGFTENIQIRYWDNHNQKIDIFNNEKYLIRDIEDKEYTTRNLF